jgi:hypothetical protein
MSAVISGTNEFSPGQDTVISCVAPSLKPGGVAAFLPVIILVVIVIGAGYYLLVVQKKN